MKDWVFQQLLQNTSFPKLPEKTRYTLPARIALELQRIYEARGETFLEAYKAELQPRLIRTNWLWNQHPMWTFKKWNIMRREIVKALAGQDKLTKPAPEVLAMQCKTIQDLANAIADKLTIHPQEQKWIKTPNGWLRAPNQ